MQDTPKLLDLEGLRYYNSLLENKINTIDEYTQSLGYVVHNEMQPMLQYSEVPEASEDNEGKILQYIGETDSNYTQGYFYKCVGDYTQSEPTFSWEQVDVAGIGTALNQSY